MSTERNSQKKLEESWGADNIPLGLSLAMDEPPVEGTPFKRLPSFRAILTHKLNMICRTCNPPTWRETALTLRVAESVCRKWRAWTTAPGSVLTLQRIDTAYEVALERLKLQTAKAAQNEKH